MACLGWTRQPIADRFATTPDPAASFTTRLLPQDLLLIGIGPERELGRNPLGNNRTRRPPGGEIPFTSKAVLSR